MRKVHDLPKDPVLLEGPLELCRLPLECVLCGLCALPMGHISALTMMLPLMLSLLRALLVLLMCLGLWWLLCGRYEEENSIVVAVL